MEVLGYKSSYTCIPPLHRLRWIKSTFVWFRWIKAEVAHLVEHDLAKVGVAGSSPVFRSRPAFAGFFFISSETGNKLQFFIQYSLFLVQYSFRPGGGTGRHAGLKIL